MDNFQKIVNYTRNRIYCCGECSGKFDEEMAECVKKFEDLLQNPNYDVCNDLDEMQNNVLHQIAEHGLYEFYAVLKNNKNFDKLKNMTNSNNMTPRDIAEMNPIIIKNVISLTSGDSMLIIPVMVTVPYYNVSVGKLYGDMKNDGLLTNNSIKQNTILYFEKYKENPIVVVMLEELEKMDENQFEAPNNDKINASHLTMPPK